MKKFVKLFLSKIADQVNEKQGYRLPSYFFEKDRILFLLGRNEPDLRRFFNQRLAKGMVVLDVGGNVGLVSRICARNVGSTGRVIAFEPDPYTREFLMYNVKNQANIQVSPVALSDENTMANLHIHPRSGTSNSLIAFDGAKETVQVECKKIDTYLLEHPYLKPDYVKIDVEGAELKVLGGMRDTIARLPKLKIVIEYCPENLANGGVSPEDYYTYLNNLGLSVEIIKKDGSAQPVSNLTDLSAKLGKKVYCNLLCQSKARP